MIAARPSSATPFLIQFILFCLLIFSTAPHLFADENMPVGSVGGEVRADLFTGTATTSIPIQVPPGRQAVQPELALTYGSANGNGWVGVGWKLEKSVIERQTKDGLDYNGDDYVFRLSGINVELINTTGNEYYSKIEGSFTKVEKLNDSSNRPYFVATDKMGKKHYFGQYAATRVADPNDADRIFRWCLDRVEDVHGNYMVINYSYDQGQAYLSRIDYTGNTVLGLKPTNSVVFHLEDRNDANPSYLLKWGTPQKMAKRLKTVEVRANTDVTVNSNGSVTVNNAGTLQRAYKLEYDYSTSTDRSLLESVQQYGDNATLSGSGTVTGGTSLPAITFSWRDDATGDFTFHRGDEDPGDGSDWLPGASTTTNSYLNNSYKNIHKLDLNGDGLTDMLHLHSNSDPIYSWVALADGDGTFTFHRGDEDPGDGSNWLPGASTATNSFLNDYRNIHLADWNNDGLTDMLHLHPESGSQFSWVALSDGDGTFTFHRGDETHPNGGKWLPDTSTINENAFMNVADYNIHLADWNNDGLTDMLHLHHSSGSQFSWVALSDGDGSFTFHRGDETHPNGGKWLPDTSSINENAFLNAFRNIHVIDLDGDGLRDMLHLHHSSGSQFSWVALSDGDGSFTFHRGDEIHSAGGKWLPDTSSTTENAFLNAYNDIHPIDLNGDGLTDLVHMHPASAPEYSWVAFSDGDGTFTFHSGDEDPGDGSTWLPSTYQNSNQVGQLGDSDGCRWAHHNIHVGDWNGDGLTDMLHLDSDRRNSENSWIAYSDGDGTFTFDNTILPDADELNNAYINNGRKCDNILPAKNIHVGDWDGDGLADMLHLHPNANPIWSWVALTNGSIPDLLVSVSNGLGGSSTIEYSPSTDFSNTQLPFVTQVVTKITTDDGRGNVSSTDYEYDGGYFHLVDREFRGFNHVKVTGPAGPNGERTVTHSYFHQGNDTAVGVNDPSASIGYTKGSVYRQEIKNGTDTAFWTITKTQYTPDADGQEPWYTPPQWVEVKVYDGVGGFVKTFTEYFYDSYGNVTEERQHGDTSTSDDDHTVVQTFSYNTTDRLLSFPKSKTTYEGLGTTGTQVSHADLYYDGTSSCGTPSTNQLPTKGLLTRSVNWLDGSSNPPETRIAYNAAGNPICSRDANGNTSTMEYDDEEVFETSSTNALGHTASTKYYGVDGESMTNGLYGQIKETIDPNGAKVSTVYDALGRVTTVTDSEGITSTTSYLNFGNVSSQQLKADGPLGQTTQVYFDGLGRKYRSKSTGPNNGSGVEEIITDTVYDLRGNVEKTSLPYFSSGGTAKWVVNEYDVAGRVTKVTSPDGSFILNCYDDWTSASVDANGHKTRQIKNVFGKPLTVQKFSGTYSSCDPNSTSGVYSEITYEYDIQGKLLKTTDDKGNESILTYNTLSQKIGMDDPDMGAWSYEYDNAGNIVKQTDAKGQVTHFQYDAVNRLVQKDYGTIKTLGVGDVVYTYDGGSGGSGGGTQTSVEFQEGLSGYSGAKDAWLDEANPSTNNNGTDIKAWGNTSGSDRKIIFSWDVSSIPNGATIDSASITLDVFNSSADTYYLREAKSTWSESTVNWSNYSGSNDIGTTNLGTIQFNNNTGTQTFSLNAAGEQLIEDWVNGTKTNNGFVILATGTANNLSAYSSEASSQSPRPKLNITYTSGGGGGGTQHTVDYKEGVLPDSSYSGTSDAWINEALPTDNQNTTDLKADGDSGSERKVVLKWDVSSIPSGSTIDSASISLYVWNASAGTYVLREAKVGWSESTVDWNDFNQSGDIGTTDLGSITASSTGTYTFNLNVAGEQLIEDWVNGTKTNNGFVIQTSGTTDGLSFSSSEAGQSARPQLSITYTTGGGGGGSVANGIGRLIKVEDGSGSTSFGYDIKGRTIRSDKVINGESQTYTSHSTYDDLDRLKTQTYPDGTVITYIYNGPLLESVNDATQTFVTYSDFNANGQYEKAEYGNGVTTDYTYDPDNFRLDSMLTQNDHPVVSTFQDLDYTFDSGGNITQITDAVRGNKTYVYDDHDRLTKATHNGSSGYGVVDYTYDTIGNMTSNSRLPNGGSYVYNPSGSGSVRPHAVTSAGGVTYSYDANGNMTSGDGRSLTYDFENRPTQITKGGVVTDFVYDGDGGRVKKTVGGVDTLYIGKSQVCEGGNCFNYIFDGGTRIARVDSTGVKYFHSDHLGSTSVVTDGSGNNVEDVIYYPYGKPYSDTNSSLTRYKFTGKELDDSTDLYFYGARYYDANIGRFTSADDFVQNPLDYESLNRYTYVRNNPIVYTDPSGNFFTFLFAHALVAAAVATNPYTIQWVGVQGYLNDWNISLIALNTAVAIASAGVGAAVGSAVTTATHAIIGGLAGAAAGAATSAALYDLAGHEVNYGQSILSGVVSGAIGMGVGHALQGFGVQAQILGGYIASGIQAELTGGDFSTSIISGMSMSWAGYLGKGIGRYLTKRTEPGRLSISPYGQNNETHRDIRRMAQRAEWADQYDLDLWDEVEKIYAMATKNEHDFEYGTQKLHSGTIIGPNRGTDDGSHFQPNNNLLSVTSDLLHSHPPRLGQGAYAFSPDDIDMLLDNPSINRIYLISPNFSVYKLVRGAPGPVEILRKP